MEDNKEVKDIKDVINVKEIHDVHKETKELIEEHIKTIISDGIQKENLDTLYKLVDIHKDLCNEEYWKEKIKYMAVKYGTYDKSDDYVIFDNMKECYCDYKEYSEEYHNGNRRAATDTMKSLDYMLRSAEQFFKMLWDDAKSPEERQLIQKTIINLNRS